MGKKNLGISSLEGLDYGESADIIGRGGLVGLVKTLRREEGTL
jgi:hypothetical protein